MEIGEGGRHATLTKSPRLMQMVTTQRHSIDPEAITSMRVLEETDNFPTRLRVNTEKDMHIIEGDEAVVFMERLMGASKESDGKDFDGLHVTEYQLALVGPAVVHARIELPAGLIEEGDDADIRFLIDTVNKLLSQSDSSMPREVRLIKLTRETVM